MTAQPDQPQPIAPATPTEDAAAAAVPARSAEQLRAELEGLPDDELTRRYEYLPQRARNQSAVSFNLLPLGVALLVFFIDQIVKLYTTATFLYDPAVKEPASKRVELLGEYLTVVYRQNTGGAFSFFRDAPWLFTTFASLIIVAILVFIFFFPQRAAASTWLGVILGLILGGAGGNLLDRLRLGYVIDMIDFRIPQWGFHWPTFNVADSMIVVGFIMLFVYVWRDSSKKQAVEQQEGGVARPLHTVSEHSTVRGRPMAQQNSGPAEIQVRDAERDLRPQASQLPAATRERQERSMYNYVKYLSEQRSLDRSVTEHPLDEQANKVKPWGVLAMVGFLIGTFALGLVQAFRDVRVPWQKQVDNVRLAKDYAKESKRLAKESQKLAKQAKSYAKLAKDEVKARAAAAKEQAAQQS